MILKFGCLCEPLSKQLSGSGISRADVAQLQMSADAITRLFVVGLLTEAETEQARIRLGKQIGILSQPIKTDGKRKRTSALAAELKG